MKQKALVRIMCLVLVVVMVGGVLVGALSTLATASTNEKNVLTTSKTGLAAAAQPEITFYDIENNLIGTFSNGSNSSLVGFDAAKLVYQDDNGEMVEANYSRADLKMYLYDRNLPYDSIDKISPNTFYCRYNMGSSSGAVFANKINLHTGKTDRLYFDVLFENISFRDSNKIKITSSYQMPTSKKVANKKTNILKTITSSGTFTITRAKLDQLVVGTSSTNQNGQDVPDGTTNKPGTTTTTPQDVATPYLIIDNFSTGEEKQIVAGETFPLSISCKNTSTDVNLENIIVKITASEGLQLSEATNIFYIPQLGKGGTFEKELNISVLPNAEAKSHNIDIAFSYEYNAKNARQKGEMTQQIAIPTVQRDRFSADPVEDLKETSAGEEFDVVGKYVNKSRGEIYNLSAVIEGNFPESGKIKHVGNVAAGISGEVEFTLMPDTPGDLNGTITYTYEDAVRNLKTLVIPFQTKINEAPTDMNAMGMGGDMMASGDIQLDENGNPIDPNAPPEKAGLKAYLDAYLLSLRDPNSWQLWATVGGAAAVVIIIFARAAHKKKVAKEFEDD